jgi:hypothetical protein
MKSPIFFAQVVADKTAPNMTEPHLPLFVLAFTLLVMAIIVWVSVRKDQGWGATSSKLIIITLVVGGALFILAAGYSAEQMNPILTLLGTIIGYALGKKEDANQPTKPDAPVIRTP